VGLTTRGEALRAAIARLRASGSDTASLDARLLLAAALGLDETALYAAPETPLDGEETKRVEDFIARREAGEPVGRILGRREFWSLSFALSPETLEPRPDSETLIEAALELWRGRAPPSPILDLGTGSGCLLLALLGEWKTSFGVGVDRSPGAAAAARANAQALGFGGRSAFLVGDWAAALCGPFPLIVSNPPYIETESVAALDRAVRDFDPIAALDGGASGLDAYRTLVPQAAARLAPAGWLVLEIGSTQVQAVRELVQDAGLRSVAVRADLGGRPRCVLAQKPH
jgi:release factor glutamine methyltransferase